MSLRHLLFLTYKGVVEMSETAKKKKLAAALAVVSAFFRPVAQEVIDEGVQEARKTPVGKIALMIIVVGSLFAAAYIAA